MKGIILAAGKGSRLYPMTYEVPKPMLPIYDKPMIYYPLSTLISLGIKEILLIVDSVNKLKYVELMKPFNSMGLDIKVKVQHIPRGIADAFIVGEEFIGDDDVCLILGDNLFLSYNSNWLENCKASQFDSGAKVLAYAVPDPERFGVVEFDESGKAISIEEKPENPKSGYIIPGLYWYDNRVVEIAKSIKPSARGELEITSVNQRYLEMKQLAVTKIHNVSWYDTGTADSLLEASKKVQILTQSFGAYLGMPEVEAHRAGLIDDRQYVDLIIEPRNSRYSELMNDYARSKNLI